MSASGRSNPIVAGDRVELSSPHAGEYVIERLIPRKTLISRGSDKRRGRTHTIIANADHALVVFAADKPRSRVPGIDRYIVACEYQHLDVTLVFNKWDLADDESRALAELYERAGYTVLRTCAISEPELTRQQVMNVDFQRLYVLGPSGVGKSSITNAILPNHGAATGAVNDVTGKGRQTTTHIEMVPLGQGRYLADTPGLGHLTMLGIEPHNLRNLYREFVDLAPRCRYPDCLHIDEPHCAVKEELGGAISRKRYESYCDFVADLSVEYERAKVKGRSRR
jgi:ribosome biogenesis GTPase